MSTRPQFAIVPDPDTELRALFKERDEAAADLARIDEAIAAGVRAYSARKGCTVLRRETVRLELGK